MPTLSVVAAPPEVVDPAGVLLGLLWMGSDGVVAGCGVEEGEWPGEGVGGVGHDGMAFALFSSFFFFCWEWESATLPVEAMDVRCQQKG